MTTTDTRKIVAALDLSALPQQEQEQLLIDLNDLVFRGSLLRLVERMEDSSLTALENLIAQGASDEEISAFLTERVPGTETVVAETLKDLAGDILMATGSN